MREIPDSAALASAVFLHKQSQDPASQIAQVSVSLGEPMPVDAIKQAWDAVARATPVIQGGFARTSDGQAVFQESAPQGLRWNDLDWSGREIAEVPTAWSALLAENLTHPIATNEPPLLRGTTIKLPGGFTHLLLSFPRFLFTENSFFALVSRWLAALEGHAPETPIPEPDQPADQSVTDWWRKYLAGAPRPLDLHILPQATDLPGPAQQESVLLTREESRHILDLAAKLKVPPRILFLGLSTVVFGRLGGSSDVVLLDASSFLPVRASLDANTPLDRWISSLASSEENRIDRAAFSLPHVLGLGGYAGTPIFPTAFQWSPALLNDRIHDAFPRWINADVKIMRQPIAPLTLEIREAARFQIDLHFSPARFSGGQIKTLFNRLLLALESVRQNPSVKLSEINILDESELDSLATGKNVPASQAKPVELRITEIAARQPDDLAIKGDGDVGLSFSEVASHAKSLAAYLRQENIADGWVVASCLTPTPWVPVVLLGVMEAGNTCVPLDPSASPSWLAEKTAACDAETIICDSQTAGLFEGSTRRILVIDRQWEEISAVPLPSATPTIPKAAFVLTGGEFDAEPQLKLLSPQMISAACKESASRWRLKSGDRVPLLPTAGSGAYVETILSSLASGATIVLPSGASPSLASLHEPTHLRLTLGQWRKLALDLKSGAQSLPESLRAVCVGAGSLPATLLANWNQLIGPEIATHLFWSPADLSGLSIRSYFKGSSFDTAPVGTPTPGLSIAFNDACGKELPPRYAGDFDIALADDASAKWKLRAWKNEDGLFHLIEEQPSHLPGVVDFQLAEIPAEPRPQLGLWVITQDSAPLTPESRQTAEAQLPAKPDFVLTVDSFPLTSGGNIDVSRLPRPAAPAKPTAPVRAAAAPAPAPKPVAPATEWEPLQLLHKNDESPILVLIHDLDGDPARYEALARLLKSDWTIYGTVARGLHNPTACHQNVESEAAAFVEAVCSLDPAGPYYLLGYGYGAILAYEMARQLRRAGRSVDYLALIGSQPPALATGKSWLKPLARLFGGAKKEITSASPVVQAHLQARQNYQTEALPGAAGIILGSDINQDGEDAWLTAVPEGIIERMSSASDQMLAEPAVKRLGVILAEWAEGDAEESVD